MDKKSLKITISIVNTNNRDLLKSCLQSIYDNTREKSFEIIVVDNCSTDGSLEMVYENFPGARIGGFKFRAVRPTFDSHPFTLRGRRSGKQLLLWSEDHEGYLCMKAEATIESVA